MEARRPLVGLGVVIAADVRGRAPAVLKALSPTGKARLLRRLGRAMEAAGVGEDELSLSLVDDDEIHALNRQYRKEDHATDVLSFSLAPDDDGGGGHDEIGGGLNERLLGDVVISVETAARQASAQDRPLDAELLHLAVHGLVHLLGYDHATVAEERVMFGFEALLREQALGRGGVEEIPAPEKQATKQAKKRQEKQQKAARAKNSTGRRARPVRA